MTVERFANLAETSLASGYTSGGASISVTSAAGFPSAGVFRVRLGNTGKTIYRVDSVSGTTFTGAAEANDANANSGDSVKIVASKAVAERFLQAPEAGEANAFGGLAAADEYGPIYKLTRLDQSGWSWVNQGGAAVTQGSGVVFLTIPTNVAENVRGRFVAAPATPWTRTVGLNNNPILGNCAWGFWLRESGTGKLVGTCFRTPSGDTRPLLSARKYTSPTVFSSQSEIGPIVPAAMSWFRLADNGTNITLSYSFDSVNYTTLLTETRGTFFTTGPDEIGIAGHNFSGTTVGFSVLSLV
jgi:hypothetical protein